MAGVPETPGGMIGLLLATALRSVSGLGSRGAERRARRQAEHDERMARRQRQQWLELVQRQMARGRAGDASQQDAITALRGRGGRSSKLDREFF
jgi:hypothetical protein